MWIADYSNTALNATALKAAGASGVIRYTAPAGRSKNITPSEYAHLCSVFGQENVVFNFEDTGKNWLGGYNQAVIDAGIAIKFGKDFLYPNGMAYYNSDGDFNVQPSQVSICLEYMSTWGRLISAQGWEPGGYSHVDMLETLYKKGIFHLWQSMSTAYGFTLNANAVQGSHTQIWQKSRKFINGIDYDQDLVINSEWNGSTMDPEALRLLRNTEYLLSVLMFNEPYDHTRLDWGHGLGVGVPTSLNLALAHLNLSGTLSGSVSGTPVQ